MKQKNQSIIEVASDLCDETNSLIVYSKKLGRTINYELKPESLPKELYENVAMSNSHLGYDKKPR